MISPVLRPKLWSALLGAVAAAVLSAPAYADPPLPSTVPDSGARPVVSGSLTLPGGVPLTPTPGTGAPVNLVNGPLAGQIYAAEARIGQLGDELLLLRQQRTEAEAQLAAAERELALARDALARAQERADTAVAEAIKAAAALPPAEFATDLHHLNQLSRITRGEEVEGGDTTAATRELNRARTGEQAAQQALTAAQAQVQTARTAYTAGEQALRAEEEKLAKLRRDNAEQLIELERQQEAAEQALGAGYIANETANGLAAHPTALKAVAYAKAQLGDPYLWAAEGPDRFDCSGLIWAAYRSAGYYDLPRVSRDQYYATRHRTVARTALLPGDLLFFASGTSWTTIHHIGMYVGGGKMIHAPSTGDVVKISTVRWSRLYAATRVIGAVPAPTTAPTPSATPTPTTSPKPTTPTPTPSATKPPTTSPTPTPTPTPTGTTSPSPSPTPTPTGSTPAPPTSAPATTDPSSPADDPSSPSPSVSSSRATPTTAASSLEPSVSTSASASASTGS